ncbi:ATPase [Paraburkholderia flava]|uniref:ATPase n=1 Tax=Paraburkholderia flava TaxID=2547393 RepID=UPI00106146BA|nr:ATPase [Paraburkholderia flava]
MLTELETLSQNIGRLIALSQRHYAARQALEEQLTQARADCEATRVELDQMREERNALQAERDALSAKIDDAQVRLNAILEKLPRAKGHSEQDNQLDLLASAPQEDGAARSDADARHGENA